MNRRAATIIISLVVACGSSIAQAQEQSPQPRVENEQKQKTPRPPRAPRAPRAETPEPDPSPRVEPDQPVKAEPLVMKLVRGGKIAVVTRIGNIKVSGWDRDTLEATARTETGARQLKAEVSGDASHPRVYLYVPATSRRSGELDISLNLPRYADIETLESHSGDIAVNDLDGSVAITTGSGSVSVHRVGSLKVGSRSGDIDVRDIKGEVTARTFQGAISVANGNGRIDVSATNGDVKVLNSGGDIRATSATGNIEIRCAKGRTTEANSASGDLTLIGIGGDAEASTASGNVSLVGPIRSNASYRLRSIAGDVVMTVQPDPPGFTATLITYSGEIDTAFPLKLETGLPAGPTNRKVTGRYGDGQAKINMDSFSGTVRLVKGSVPAQKDCD